MSRRKDMLRELLGRAADNATQKRAKGTKGMTSGRITLNKAFERLSDNQLSKNKKEKKK
jgi:hypothetical protein|tara:strand:- start:1832 stop:2008 length:177 start_codon:yes stop_codon:yes gene_type:complete